MSTLSIDSKVFSLLKGNPAINPAALDTLVRLANSMLAFAAFSAALRLKTENSLAVVRSAFARAASVSSPLILDLDGDGVETTGLVDGVYFDHDSDGRIRSGAELFGNETVLANGNKAANGFDAFKELDGNQDGVINSADAAYARLRLWKDADTAYKDLDKVSIAAGAYIPSDLTPTHTIAASANDETPPTAPDTTPERSGTNDYCWREAA